MTSLAPGVYVNVTTGPPSAANNGSTGTWFVTGLAQAGPTGVAIPVHSLSEFTTYLGSRVSYSYLYDCLDEYFSDGGVVAYVSRIVGPSAIAASKALTDKGETPQHTLTFTANGAGTWGNSIKVVIAAGSVTDSYTVAIYDGDTLVTVTPNLFTPATAVSWFAAQDPWDVLVTVTNDGSTNAAPSNNPATGTFTLASGTDDTSGVEETQWTDALEVFTSVLGPGQVSAPGHTTTDGYEALINHASAFNRIAICDAATEATASALVTQAAAVQSAEGESCSYGAMFAPWIIIPGITSTTPGASAPVVNRTIPPSAVVAALMAANDSNTTNTCNTPAAGVNGQSKYAIGVTQSFNATERATINNGGVDLFLIPPGTGSVTLYGYVSLTTDPNWIMLNNCRFRMEMIFDCDTVGEQYVFQQITGKGQLIAKFNGSLSALFNTYWAKGAVYGTTAGTAFNVTTGPQVNTPSSIQAGELNAVISVVLSPFAEVVTIDIVKYLIGYGPNA